MYHQGGWGGALYHPLHQPAQERAPNNNTNRPLATQEWVLPSSRSLGTAQLPFPGRQAGRRREGSPTSNARLPPHVAGLLLLGFTLILPHPSSLSDVWTIDACQGLDLEQPVGRYKPEKPVSLI